MFIYEFNDLNLFIYLIYLNQNLDMNNPTIDIPITYTKLTPAKVPTCKSR